MKQATGPGFATESEAAARHEKRDKEIPIHINSMRNIPIISRRLVGVNISTPDCALRKIDGFSFDPPKKAGHLRHVVYDLLHTPLLISAWLS